MHPKPRLSWSSIAAGLLLASIALAAEPSKRHFDLPADTAEKSLKRFSEQSGRSVMFATEKVQDVRTNRVQGELTAPDALNRLLAGTPLHIIPERQTGGFAVARAASNPKDIMRPNGRRAAQTTASDRPRNRNSPPDANATDEAVQLSVFTVTGDKDEGYRSTQTLSGSRTVEELKNVANSISILNRELIDDLNVTTVTELMSFAIAGEPNTNPLEEERFVFRGIQNSFQMRDGFIWYLPKDTFTIDRVEVLRGPNGFLYGEATPGGVLNQVTKRAHGANFAQGRFSVGSFGLVRGELDVSRKLNEQLAVRINAAAQRTEGFRHHN